MGYYWNTIKHNWDSIPAFFGAGTMLVQWIEGDSEPYFLMVRNGKGSYCFTGGYDDKSEGFMNTASRELQEESAQLIQLPSSAFQGFSHVSMFCGLYRVYVLSIETKDFISENDFASNYQQLRSNYAPEHLLESHAITYVPLSQFQNLDPKEKKWVVQDYKGRDIMIYSRARTLLKSALRKKYFSGASRTKLYEQRIPLQRVQDEYIVYTQK